MANTELFIGKGRLEVLPNGELATNGMRVHGLGVRDSVKKAEFYYERFNNVKLINPIVSTKELDRYYEEKDHGNGKTVQL